MYATTHTKPDESKYFVLPLSTILMFTTVSWEDYTCQIGTEYHLLVVQGTNWQKRKPSNLKGIRDWAASWEGSFKLMKSFPSTSVTAHVKSIRDKFTNLI